MKATDQESAKVQVIKMFIWMLTKSTKLLILELIKKCNILSIKSEKTTE